ncbi:MAG: hypothetical protein M1319_03595 [Chloroflexi bacterium]|nr:hypothetical protein [Chloroflexota bacterium]
MVAKRCSRAKSVSGLAIGILLMFAIGQYGTARNQGKIPEWIDNLVFDAWGVAVLGGAFIYSRWLERRCVGDIPHEKFRVEPGEKTLFGSRFMSGIFFRNVKDFNPFPNLKDRLRGAFAQPGTENAMRLQGLLKIQVTDRRLVFGFSVLGRTWRVIPLSSVRSISELHGKWPYRDALVVEYDFAGRREALVLSSKPHKCTAMATTLRAAAGL